MPAGTFEAGDSPVRAAAAAAEKQFEVQEELRRLKERLKAGRDRSDREQQEIIGQVHEAMEAARHRMAEERNAARTHDNFLRKCRVEADAARAAFAADIRRQQAFFDASERHRARREAEKVRYAEEQQRRSDHVQYGDGAFGGAASSKPPFVATRQQEQAYAAFEAAFEAFEGAKADAALYGLVDVPWPPSGCPVSGMRKGETLEQCKQRVKLALLRWHPDKFTAAHSGKLKAAERDAITDKVHAVLRRVHHERQQLATYDEAAFAAVASASSSSSSSSTVLGGGAACSPAHVPPPAGGGRSGVAAARASRTMRGNWSANIPTGLERMRAGATSLKRPSKQVAQPHRYESRY